MSTHSAFVILTNDPVPAARVKEIVMMNSPATQCQVCWRVQGNGTGEADSTTWSDLPSFIQEHKLTAHDLSFVDGYCPQCTQLYCRLTQENLFES